MWAVANPYEDVYFRLGEVLRELDTATFLTAGGEMDTLVLTYMQSAQEDLEMAQHVCCDLMEHWEPEPDQG